MDRHSHIISKILSREQLKEKVESWKREKCKVVFTNGCFDLLHMGHVDYLAKAASFGDKMIVALNTDASVQKIKGPLRPITDEKSRLMVMASLEVVDAVTLFDEDTPLDLIKMLLPDVLVKGADYTPESIVGYDVVTTNGGTVETVELVAGYSTTAIENRIRSLKL